MRRRSIAALVMFLLMWPLLAEGSVQGMLICIHESAHHKGGGVHFHPGSAWDHGHHPCGQSQTEMCTGQPQTTCRHIPVKADYARGNLLPHSETKPCGAVLPCPFEYPSRATDTISCESLTPNPILPSKTVDFRKTTVLII